MTNVAFKTSAEPVEYPDAIESMESCIAAINKGESPETIWFLEHPPLYTAGTSACETDLLNDQRFPVFKAGRGGKHTYHGPGQRVVYVMLDLKKRNNPDVKDFVYSLEKWIINSLQHFRISGERREGRIGIWVVDKNGKEAKVAALGVRVRKWVTYHGVALNVAPDLDHYKSIIPCGISEYGATSLKELGVNVAMEEVDKVLKEEFLKVF